jgi:hypothetical protein
LQLINDILDLSKIEAGRMELEVGDFDLPAALQNALTLVRERAQRHSIELGLKVDPALGDVPRRRAQVQTDHAEPPIQRGEVHARGRQRERRCEAERFGGRGCGLGHGRRHRAEDQAIVFEEFRQVGHDYTRKARVPASGSRSRGASSSCTAVQSRSPARPARAPPSPSRFPSDMANELILIVETTTRT